AGAAIAHVGFNAIAVGPIVKIVSFIFLAPVVGMLIAFIISIWFLNSFRKSFWPKLISFMVMLGVVIFLAEVLVTDPAQLGSHYKSYALKVLFDSNNFKWILLCFILFVMSVFALFLSSLNYIQSERWFKRMQLVSSAAFSIEIGR